LFDAHFDEPVRECLQPAHVRLLDGNSLRCLDKASGSHVQGGETLQQEWQGTIV
jgi:hypothetical protein